MPNQRSRSVVPSRDALHACVTALAFVLLLAWGDNALAYAPGDFEGQVCGFMGKIKGLLNAVSIGVVTIAVMFAGYQIAFAHKRIADVAPILIGGVLVGAAGQLAKLLIGDEAGDCTAYVQGASLLFNA